MGERSRIPKDCWFWVFFILVTPSLRKPTESHHKLVLYYYANYILRERFFSALHDISAFDFFRRRQTLSQPPQNWQLHTAKPYSWRFLSCGVMCSGSRMPMAHPAMSLPLLPAPRGKVPAPGQPCGDTAGRKQELEPVGWGAKWSSRARQARGCHFHATFLCLPAPKRDNGSGRGRAAHLGAWPPGWCSPQKRGQWEQWVCSPLERLCWGGDPHSAEGWWQLGTTLERGIHFKNPHSFFYLQSCCLIQQPCPAPLASLHGQFLHILVFLMFLMFVSMATLSATCPSLSQASLISPQLPFLELHLLGAGEHPGRRSHPGAFNRSQ